MKKQITYNWARDHLLIDLGNRIEPRIRLLFSAELLITCGLATIVLFQAFPVRGQWIHICTAVGAAMMYLLAGIRFLSRIYLREQLMLNQSHFILIQKTIFNKNVQRYDWQNVGPLHYVGKDRKTDHPLKGRHFDYFGFESHEHLVQALHQEGGMFFHYQHSPVRFGRFVYSWDADEIVRMMKLYMGNTLQLSSEWKRMMQEHEWDDAQS